MLRALLQQLELGRTGRLRAVRACPKLPKTKLLWAREDALVSPRFGPRYQALLGGAELVWLDQSSHFTQVDSPERTVEEILRFLG